MTFATRSNPPKTIPFYVGDGLEPVFEERENCIVCVGQNPMNPFVQESLDDTLIYNLLERYQRGDVSVLERMTGQYFDATKMPSDLRGAQDVLLSVQNMYDRLPKAVKSKYPTFHQFVDEVSHGSVESVLHDFGFRKPSDSIEKNVESEVDAK